MVLGSAVIQILEWRLSELVVMQPKTLTVQVGLSSIDAGKTSSGSSSNESKDENKYI